MSRNIYLGCIADDFTGGSDAASFLAAGGLKTVLLSGIPEEGFMLPEDCEAAVIALKSRTQKTEDAVADSLQAIRWLKGQGAKHYYVKYCSTFDSTPEGNIGPILDAVVEELDTKASILCPALPANGRTVKNGLLYVNGIPLAESSMKDHPLTPMWESRIALLMEPQSRYETVETGAVREESADALRQKLAEFSYNKKHYYIIPDYEDEADAVQIVNFFGNMTVLSGGSGILTELARFLKEDQTEDIGFGGVPGKAILLAGSCSVATNLQRQKYTENGGVAIRLEDEALLSGIQNPQMLWQNAEKLSDPLVYAYETPEGLKAKRNQQGRAIAALIEKTLAETAALAVENGTKRIIVAGGETSGAVTQRLGYRCFWIGKSIAPGVPVLIPLEDPDIRLVLKSGNFGQEDFFLRALRITKE